MLKNNNIISEIYNIGVNNLKNIVPNPCLESEILLMHVLQKSREYIILNAEKVLSIDNIKLFLHFVERRKKLEPLAYIIGYTEFYSRNFVVNPKVLIPRPETELLIDTAKEFIINTEQSFSFADFGSGTGCIIVTILLEFVNCFGTAFDISDVAIKNTTENILKYNLSCRSCILHKSWVNLEKSFDYIFCNPPYIPSGDIQKLMQDVKYYESHQALDGGTDGFDYYRLIIPLLTKHLNKIAFIEIGYNQFDYLYNMFQQSNFNVLYKEDLQKIKRVLIISKNN